MDAAELEYRALLSLIYAEAAADLDDVSVVYEDTPSCISLASALTALLMARGKKVSAAPASRLEGPVDSAFIVMGPYRDGLADAVASILPLVKKVAVLHTPAYFAVEELDDFPKLVEGKEVRYAVREEPGEITFYKVRASGGRIEKSEIAKRRLTAAESRIVRRYEASVELP